MACKDGNWAYPVVVDWVADLNSSLQSVVERGGVYAVKMIGDIFFF